jgi:hypothetical protein
LTPPLLMESSPETAPELAKSTRTTRVLDCVAAAHGSDMDSHHVATEQLYTMSPNEQDVFQTILKPDDSYDETGTYWADLPLLRRIKFVNRVNNEEAKKEWSATWNMFKRDPLSPLGYYMRNMVVPGLGLLLEGYVLFSIGNIKPLLQAAFSECWKHRTV